MSFLIYSPKMFLHEYIEILYVYKFLKIIYNKFAIQNV